MVRVVISWNSRVYFSSCLGKKSWDSLSSTSNRVENWQNWNILLRLHSNSLAPKKYSRINCYFLWHSTEVLALIAWPLKTLFFSLFFRSSCRFSAGEFIGQHFQKCTHVNRYIKLRWLGVLNLCFFFSNGSYLLNYFLLFVADQNSNDDFYICRFNLFFL